MRRIAIIQCTVILHYHKCLKTLIEAEIRLASSGAERLNRHIIVYKHRYFANPSFCILYKPRVQQRGRVATLNNEVMTNATMGLGQTKGA